MPHAYKSTDLVNDFKFFRTGYVLIDEHRYDVEEISVNTSVDMAPYNVAAQVDPIDNIPGKLKIDFSMKRAFSDATLSTLLDKKCKFDLILVNNDDPDNPQRLLLLKDCRLNQDNIGPINGGDVVSQDLQGVATKRIWKMCDIRSALEKHCSRQCPDGTGFIQEKVEDAAYNLATSAASTVDAFNFYKPL